MAAYVVTGGKLADVLIAQITDTHVTQDGAQAAYLADAIDWINQMRPRPIVVLVSGDTVNDGQRDQYAILGAILARCSVAVYLVPGNHDRREALRDVLPASFFPGTPGERLHYVLDTHPVRLIGLDTAERGRPGGYLDDAGLAWLESTLLAAPDRPTLIFMHHPPFRTGVNAADMLGFRGVRRFGRIAARHQAVRRIIAGHIHCERRADIGYALATTSISSAPQRVPELFEHRILGLRREAPGFATHAWSNGTFTSKTYLNVGAGRFVEREAGG
jgi:3',5'-cyclic AMP phosphodiesterase CpdA